MKTYTQVINQILTESQNNTVENTANVKIWYNQSLRTISSIRSGKWKWLETTDTIDTIANTDGYFLPNNMRKLVDLYVTVGTGISSTKYLPIAIYDPNKWKEVIASNLGTSDVALFYYVENSKIYLSPVPSTTGNKIHLRGRLNISDENVADYTTGTISAIAQDDTTVTGATTVWTSAMAGRYLQITAPTGDNFWYKIVSVTSTTELELERPYQGETLAAASAAYIIGEVPPIPEAYQDAPIYRTLAIYWAMHGDKARSQMYWLMYDGGKEAGLSSNYGGIMKEMFDESGATTEGSYISPNNYQRFDPNNPQPVAGQGSFI